MVGAGRAFEDLVAELFSRLDLSVEREVCIGDRTADMRVTTADKITAVVEVKFFRSSRIASGTLLNIAMALESLRISAGTTKSVLVINAKLEPLDHASLREYRKLVIYDYDVLTMFFDSHPDLARQFQELTRQSSAGGHSGADENRLPRASAPDVPSDLTAFVGEPSGEIPRPARKGYLLCLVLRRLVQKHAADNTDKSFSRRFERICSRALKYVFQDDLVAWRRQHKTETNMYRFDLLARISSRSDFWLQLCSHFNARYVIFEFKLYGKLIGQGEVLTTEKYLYKAALRPVAFIISAHGPNDSAEKMARGALRENGKLILLLSVEDVCKMLHARDGEPGPDLGPADPEEVLFQMLDDMLMEIER